PRQRLAERIVHIVHRAPDEEARAVVGQRELDPSEPELHVRRPLGPAPTMPVTHEVDAALAAARVSKASAHDRIAVRDRRAVRATPIGTGTRRARLILTGLAHLPRRTARAGAPVAIAARRAGRANTIAAGAHIAVRDRHARRAHPILHT